jgi:hypothetical protein
MKLNIAILLTIYFIICQVTLSNAGGELDRWIIGKVPKKYLRKINHDEKRIIILARILSMEILERCKAQLTAVDLSDSETEKIVDEIVYAFIHISIEDLGADLREPEDKKLPFLADSALPSGDFSPGNDIFLNSASLSKSNVSSCPARKKLTGKWQFLRTTYV